MAPRTMTVKVTLDEDQLSYLREAVDVKVFELPAEIKRLREAMGEATLRLGWSLARHRDLDLDLVSYRHVADAHARLNVALDASDGEA